MKERLGFSPDEADAVVMAWFEGARFETPVYTVDPWNARRDNYVDARPIGRSKKGMQPVVVMGRQHAIRHRR